MKKLKLVFALSLLPMLFIIKNIEVGNPLVEKYYSEFFYLFISEKLRLMTGWLSIPIGDLLYLFMIIILIYFIFFRIKSSINKYSYKSWLLGLCIYIPFLYALGFKLQKNSNK